MDKQEAYSLLGVESGDKLRDVRRKYHLLMHMHHPDVLSDNGNTDTARQLNEAFEIIKREGISLKRIAYTILLRHCSCKRQSKPGFKQKASEIHGNHILMQP